MSCRTSVSRTEKSNTECQVPRTTGGVWLKGSVISMVVKEAIREVPFVGTALRAKDAVSSPKQRRRVSLPAWIMVVITITAVVGLNSVLHFFTWPSISIFGSKQTAPAELSPVLVMPTVPVKLDQLQNNNYGIDYTSPVMCRTLLGGCIPYSYASKEIREIGTVPMYVKDVIQPKDIGIEILQATAKAPTKETKTRLACPG